MTMTEDNIQLRSGGLGILNLAGKVAVVTGASSGIGAATARALAAQGATVVAGFNTGADRAEAVVSALPGEGHRAARLPLEDPEQLDAVAAEVRAAYGRCDILVNSAGSTQRIAHADFDTMTPELFESLLRVNVTGPYTTVRAFAPLLRESGDSVIVNVSSVSGLTASGSNVAYCAAKAALDNLTMSLGRVLGPQIRVVGVAPAAVETGFVAGRGRDAIAAQAATTPLKVIVHPDDVAAGILAVVTHLRVSTGTTIVTDGGKRL